MAQRILHEEVGAYGDGDRGYAGLGKFGHQPGECFRAQEADGRDRTRLPHPRHGVRVRFGFARLIEGENFVPGGFRGCTRTDQDLVAERGVGPARRGDDRYSLRIGHQGHEKCQGGGHAPEADAHALPFSV